MPKAGQILTKNAFNTWLYAMKDISQENVGKICQSYLDQISVVDQQTLHCKHLKLVRKFYDFDCVYSEPILLSPFQNYLNRF